MQHYRGDALEIQPKHFITGSAFPMVICPDFYMAHVTLMPHETLYRGQSPGRRTPLYILAIEQKQSTTASLGWFSKS